jgi:haloalkane dehalogenase
MRHCYRSAVETVATVLIGGLSLVASAAPEQTTAIDIRAEAISAAFPYESRFVEVQGSKLHYIEKGEGCPILFLHGNPTSSYLWRNVIPFVAPVGRAMALDLIGFGKSDKPPIGYTFQEHYAYVEAFIEALHLRKVTLVLHDWGSVLGLEYARRHPGNVRGVVFMEAIVPPLFPARDYAALDPGGELFRRFRSAGEGRHLLIDQNYFIEQIVANATLTRKLSQAELDAYRAPFLDPASRVPIYVFPNELPIGGVPARNVVVVDRIGHWLKTSDTPKLLLYVRPGGLITPDQAAWMGEHYRNIDLVFVGYGKHYMQEDQPEAIGRNIASWYRRTIGH